MDSEYVIERLKATPYKFATVEVLKRRLDNMDDYHKDLLILHLKKEIKKEENAGISHFIEELIYKKPL